MKEIETSIEAVATRLYNTKQEKISGDQVSDELDWVNESTVESVLLLSSAAHRTRILSRF